MQLASFLGIAKEKPAKKLFCEVETEVRANLKHHVILHLSKV